MSPWGSIAGVECRLPVEDKDGALVGNQGGAMVNAEGLDATIAALCAPLDPA